MIGFVGTNDILLAFVFLFATLFDVLTMWSLYLYRLLKIEALNKIESIRMIIETLWWRINSNSRSR